MHAITTCDFSVSHAPYDKIKPFPYRHLDFVQTNEIVQSIINSVDRFYKPRTTCRRLFDIYAPYVTKYYPNCARSLMKQISFLHKDPKSEASSNFFTGKKCVSLFDVSSAEHFFYNDRRQIIKACQDFLIEERFAFNKPRHAHNFADSSVSGVVKRSKGSGKGFKRSYRKSFPLMLPKAGSVSLGNCWFCCLGTTGEDTIKYIEI